ncbi:MAG: transglutaminase domain-containing protein [Prevotellaceae bacterium]|jgi:hypothetical protein|nr:transglutaminase domain-containing protein [Prevotellaceae bacterium]
MKTKLIYLIVGMLLIDCTNSRYFPEIENVLRQAGENRRQLEKVLKRYSRNPADSLKLRAAEFLIANMPDKYSVEYDVPFENLMALYMRLDGIEDKKFVDKAYGLMKHVIKEDIKYITGDYLINNIELAFKMWEEQPWGKDVPFDVFCEEILPYRVANEPLENWREKVLAGFAKLNRSFKTQDGITAEDACSQVNSQLPRFKLTYDIPEMNYSMLMTATSGMCDEMTALAVFTMRALGIPVTQDYIPKWPYENVGHTWNSVYSSKGIHISFAGTESNPEWGNNKNKSSLQINKVYRRTFAKQKNIEADKTDIPPDLHDQYIKDVTHEYFTADTFLLNNGGCKVEIPVKYQPLKNTGYAYLFSKGKDTWNIIGWGETDTEIVNFGTAGKNILYLPLYYADNIQTPVHYPFFVDSNNSLHILEPDTSNYRQFTVTEISPSTFDYMERMHLGVFEGANRDDFSGAEVLHTIVQPLDGTYFYSTKIRIPKPYRYVRYISYRECYGNVAEIELYSDSGEKLGGKPFGSPSDNPDATCDKAFDGDIFTFFDSSLPHGGWTGLDFGEQQTVAEIRYFPRHDGNFIYEGHTYDFFIWKDKDWQVAEQYVATSHFLNLRIPANGLFYLKNVTTNKTGSWFTVNKNGEQRWI